MIDSEIMASEVGNSKAELRKRLGNSLKMRGRDVRKQFGKVKFDFKNKRLVSWDGSIALQWQLRQNPEEPISYENQQTSLGSVHLSWRPF